ncbi:hypothetical protein N7513_001747 [Penicillium frequentans]|nr:hypothetical protein N7513_001747 [Penicillium glabrum]
MPLRMLSQSGFTIIADIPLFDSATAFRNAVVTWEDETVWRRAETEGDILTQNSSTAAGSAVVSVGDAKFGMK